MKYYTVKEEYINLWTYDTKVTTETIVNEKEVRRLARAWDVEEQMLIDEQLEEIDVEDMTDAQLGRAILDGDEWDPAALDELCRRGGLSDEWDAADAETFEDVAQRAAENLGVEIK